MPQASYNKDSYVFQGNGFFDSLFSCESLKNELAEVVNKNLYSNQRSGYCMDLFCLGETEYFVLICSSDNTSTYNISLLETDLMIDSLTNSNKVKKIEQEFYDILESMHDDFVIINKDGIIEKVLPNFEEMYGISEDEAVGKSVYEMEERKIFNPSIAVRVMKSMKRETVLQLTGVGKYLMCTAIPVFDKGGNINRIISFTRDVTKYEELKEEYNNLKETVGSYTTQLELLRKERSQNIKIIGNSNETKKMIGMMEKIAKFDANVLLTGESGVGKTLFAEVIHYASKRQKFPFVTINCGAIPENLLESELFGYEKGAFTGASQEGKVGLIELAHKGVLFLDEIGDMPLHLQVKILRVLQERRIERVGGTRTIPLDVRIIAATHRDLDEMVKTGEFREDLYYRLNVIPLTIPPLRDRLEDVPILVQFYLDYYSTVTDRSVSGISQETIDILANYPWPGNVRELGNVVEYCVTMVAGGEITADILPQRIKTCLKPESQSLSLNLKRLEREAITKALTRVDREGHKDDAAKLLGISRATLYRKIKEYQIGENRTFS